MGTVYKYWEYCSFFQVQKKGRDAQKANEQKKKDLEAIEAVSQWVIHKI